MRRLPLVAVVALAAGVVVGFLLGGIGPRRQLAAREAEVEQLTEELEAADTRSGLRSPVPGLDRILRPPPEIGDDQDEDIAEDTDEWRDARWDRARGDGGVRRRRGWMWGRRGRGRGAEETPLESFQRAVSIQRVRNVQSRASLEQQAGLESEELAQVDAAVEEMNQALVAYGEEMILMALEGERPPARDLLGLSHDVTGILHRAQVRLEEIVGPERMQDVETSAAEVWNHVDLERLEPAARVAVERAR